MTRVTRIGMHMVLAGVFTVGVVEDARAALLDCPASFTVDGTAKVHDGPAQPGVETAASACQYLDPPDNTLDASAGNVNTAGFFEISNWAAVGTKQEVRDNGLSGTWAIAGADFVQFVYMITFANGSNTNLISFLLNGEFSSGGWNTPFTDPPFTLSGGSTTHGVSNWGIFRAPAPTTVPEPGTLALLSLSLLGLVSTRRRSA
jgi:hypothetical protein